MVSDVGQFFLGDWMPMDSEFENATIHLHCQTISPPSPPNGYDVKVESSFDTVESYQIGSTISLTATGSQSAAVSSDIGPLVRLRVNNVEGFAVVAILSVWLQPKST